MSLETWVTALESVDPPMLTLPANPGFKRKPLIELIATLMDNYEPRREKLFVYDYGVVGLRP